MGRIFKSETQPVTTGGRVFSQNNPLVEPMITPKKWEDLSFGEKMWNTAKEIPKTLYSFIPESVRTRASEISAVSKEKGVAEGYKEVFKPKSALAIAKAPVQFGQGILQTMAQGIGGGVLGAKELVTKKPESIDVPILGRISSYQQQVKELEGQGFESGEAKALVGINAYLAIMPFATKGLESKPARSLGTKLTTKTVPLSETPEGLTLKAKGLPVPERTVTIERPAVTAIRKVLGLTEDQKRFNQTLETHLDKYFEGRNAILSKEDPLNQALLKLTDEELATYSKATQGLTTVVEPTPNLKSAIELWKKTNKEIETDLINRGKLTAEQAENRKWKPVEMTTGRTRAELQELGVEPIYYPYLAEDLLKKSDFISTTGKRTKGGYLKRFTGKLLQENGYIEDPKIALPRHRVQVFRDKMNSQLVDDIRDGFAEKDKATIKLYQENPRFAEQMGVTEWKPSGSLRFYPVYTEKAISLPESVRAGLSDISNEMMTAKAGERFSWIPENTSSRTVIGSKSSFPDWVKPELRSRKLFDSFLEKLGTEKKFTGRESLLFDEVKAEVANRTGFKGTITEDMFAGTETSYLQKQKAGVSVSTKVEDYWIPKTVADELNRFYKPDIVEKTLRMTYDPLIDMWRVSVLNLVPRWLYNNVMGNTVLATMGKTDPLAFFKSAREMIKRTGREIPEGVFSKEYAGGEMTKAGGLGSIAKEQTQFLRPIDNWLNLLEQAKNYKALRVPATATQGLIKGWIALGKPIGRLNTVVENWFRGAVYISKTEGKFLGFELDKPVPPAEGLKYVNEFLFDYGNLSRAERATFRRVLPFWNWQKNITRFALNFPAKHPIRGLIAGALLQDYVDYINEDNQAEDKTKSVLRIKTDMTYENKPLYLNIKSAIPFSDVFNTIPTDFEKAGRFLTSNPVSKIFIERAFKINSYTGQPFTQPEQLQEFDEWGKPIAPLPSLGRHVASQLPQSKMVQAILDKLRQKQVLKRYETGEPKVYNGQLQTADLLMETLGYFGIKLSAVEYNKIKDSVQRKSRLQDIKKGQYERQMENLIR